MKTLWFFLAFCILLVPFSSAQMDRERSSSVIFEPEVFWAGSVITLPSVTQLPKSNLNFTIQHAFGPVSDGLDELFGLDASANIRFGLDLGLSDRWSVGVGRSRFDKVVDLRTKVRLITLMQGARPTLVSVFGNLAFDTQKNNLSVSQKASFHGSILVARALTRKISIQVSPAFSHFNFTRENVLFDGSIEKEAPNLFTVGITTRYKATEQVALLMEYIPVLGARSDGSENAFSLGVDIETGGHIFQVFLTSTQWIVPQYVASRTRSGALDGDLGFGFTIHRVFGIGN